MNEREILDYLKNHIGNLIPLQGLSLRFENPRSKAEAWQPDFVARVSYKKLQFKLIGEIISQQSSPMLKAKLSLLKSQAGGVEGSVPILVARYLSPERRQQCQAEGIFFLDLSGNVFLEYDGLHVERIGFPNRFPRNVQNSRSVYADSQWIGWCDVCPPYRLPADIGKTEKLNVDTRDSLLGSVLALKQN